MGIGPSLSSDSGAAGLRIGHKKGPVSRQRAGRHESFLNMENINSTGDGGKVSHDDCIEIRSWIRLPVWFRAAVERFAGNTRDVWCVSESSPIESCPLGYTPRVLADAARSGALTATNTPMGWRFDRDALNRFEQQRSAKREARRAESAASTKVANVANDFEEESRRILEQGGARPRRRQ